MIRKGLKLAHPELAEGRWAEMPFALQMGNIGGEVSRAVNAKKRGNVSRAETAAARAIELFEFTIDCNQGNSTRLKELCRGKEEFCDYIFGKNSFHTDPARMVRYYDQFVTLAK